jgi:hypothetical protein
VRFIKIGALAFLLLAGAVLPKSGFALKFNNIFSFSLGGTLMIFPEDNENRSDPTPVLPAPSLSLGYPFIFVGATSLGVQLSLDYYSTFYMWDTLAYPLPAAIENRKTRMIAPVLGLQLQGCSDIQNFVSINYSAGICYDFRFGVIADDLNTPDMAEAQSMTQKINAYVKQRSLFPVVGVGVDFRVAEKILAGLDFRFWIPAWKIKHNAGEPPIEGWRFGIGMRITFAHERADKKLTTDVMAIKKNYAIKNDSDAFIVYHLDNNTPVTPKLVGQIAAEINTGYKGIPAFAFARKKVTQDSIRKLIMNNTTLQNVYTLDVTDDTVVVK